MKLENIPEYACVSLMQYFKNFDEKVLKMKEYDDSSLKEAWDFYKLYRREIDEIAMENLHLFDEISPSDLWDNWLGKETENNFQLEKPVKAHLEHAEKKLEEAGEILNLLDERAEEFNSSDNIDISSESGDDTDTKIEKLQKKFSEQLAKKSKTDFDPLAPVRVSAAELENSSPVRKKKLKKRHSKNNPNRVLSKKSKLNDPE